MAKTWRIVVAGLKTELKVQAENHTEALRKAIDLLDMTADVTECNPQSEEEPND